MTLDIVLLIQKNKKRTQDGRTPSFLYPNRIASSFFCFFDHRPLSHLASPLDISSALVQRPRALLARLSALEAPNERECMGSDLPLLPVVSLQSWRVKGGHWLMNASVAVEAPGDARVWRFV